MVTSLSLAPGILLLCRFIVHVWSCDVESREIGFYFIEYRYLVWRTKTHFIISIVPGSVQRPCCEPDLHWNPHKRQEILVSNDFFISMFKFFCKGASLRALASWFWLVNVFPDTTLHPFTVTVINWSGSGSSHLKDGGLLDYVRAGSCSFMMHMWGRVGTL